MTQKHKRSADRDAYDDGISKVMCMAAHDAGYQAYHRGDATESNPYPYGSKQFKAWNAGMVRAHKDTKEK